MGLSDVTKIIRGSDIEFIINRSWRWYTAHLEGPHWEIKAECRQMERKDLGYVFEEGPWWGMS